MWLSIGCSAMWVRVLMSVGEWLVDHGCLVIFKVLFWKVHQRSGLCFVVIYEEG